MSIKEKINEAIKHNQTIIDILNKNVIPCFFDIKYVKENPHLVCSLLKRLNLSSVITTSSPERDMKLCSDLDLTIKINDFPLAVGCRLREHKYIPRNDLTIRSLNRFTKYTEFDKINEGKGDWYFYGYLDEKNEKIEKYWVIDLHLLRNAANWKKLSKDDTILNGDGTGFIPISLSYLETIRIVISKK